MSASMLGFGELFPVVVVAFIAFAIVMIVLGFKQAAKRRAALTAWAQKHGCRFERERRSLPEEPLFRCLKQGSNRYAENCIIGQCDGREMLAFDYHYETYSTDSEGRRQTHHHRFGAVILGSAFPLASLFIRREGFFDKLTQFVGLDDIDFESAEFSRKFYVKAKEKRWAYDVITQDTMQFLLDYADGVSIEFAEDKAIVWSSRKLSPEKYDTVIHTLAGVLDRIPEYVIQQQQTGQAGQTGV